MLQLNTIAIDLAKNVFQVCIVSPDMIVKSNQQLKRHALAEYIAKQPKGMIAMEACYSSHYWARTFEAMGHSVKLIPAQHVKPFVRGNKNDHNDALAIYEASRRPFIKPVPVKTLEQQDIQALHRIREQLIRQRTGLMNQIRGILSEYGIVLRPGLSALAKALPALTEHPQLSPLLQEQLLESHVEYDRLCERIAALNKKLQQIANEHPPC